MKICTMIAGADGTGRTSLLGVLKAQRTDLGHIIDDDSAPQVQDYLQKGIDFTLKTTLSGPFAAHTAQQALDRNYKIRMYYVGLDSAEEALLRIASRMRKGGRNVPKENVRHCFAERAKALSEVIYYCQEVQFFDNENGFSAVGYYQNGVIVCYQYAPRWMKELAETVSPLQLYSLSKKNT